MIWGKARSVGGRRIVLTGATSGIGRATALLLAKRGAALVLAARNEEVLASLADECRDRGAESMVVPCDVSDPDEVQALAHRAIDAFGGFDVWVNNAGVLAIGSIDATPVTTLVRVIEVNLIGTMLGTRLAVAHFKERSQGTVINIGSALGIFPSGFAAAYVASKHAARGLSAAVREELLRHPGIKICEVLPAGVDTPILAHAANYSGRRIQPYYPLVAPDRVAKAVVRCIGRPTDRVMVGTTGRVQAILDRLAPDIHRRVVASATTRSLERAEPDVATDGALFAPIVHEYDATGGWRRGRPGAKAVVGLLVGGTAVLLAAARRTK